MNVYITKQADDRYLLVAEGTFNELTGYPTTEQVAAIKQALNLKAGTQINIVHLQKLEINEQGIIKLTRDVAGNEPKDQKDIL